jgi:hypothetical protein
VDHVSPQGEHDADEYGAPAVSGRLATAPHQKPAFISAKR